MTTTTTTTTVSTTTTLYGCVPCAAVPLASCLSLQPGETCTAALPDSVCIGGAPPVLFCPDTENENTTAPILAELANGSYPLVRCRPCGALIAEQDQDMRQGIYGGIVSFGPNEVGGVIDETAISEYRVHFGDAAGNILTPLALATAPVMNGTFDCCSSVYSAQVSGATLPPGAATLVVVAVDLAGYEMPVGLSVEISDMIVTSTTTTTPPPSCCTTRTCSCTPQFAPAPAWAGGGDEIDSLEESGAPPRAGRPHRPSWLVGPLSGALLSALPGALLPRLLRLP